MSYKQKLLTLSCLTGLLALVFALTLIFSPGRISARSSSFAWLLPDAKDRADRVEIFRSGEEEPWISMVRKDGEWFIPASSPEISMEFPQDFPAKQERIEDLLTLLSNRGSYPVRASSAASHERLGLAEGASRIVIRGGAGLPLLDLLIGGADATGREVYLRKNGQNEVRSGDNRINTYISGTRNAWYRLRLFPESSGRSFGSEAVQRVTITVSGTAPLSLVRSGGDWVMTGAPGTPDTQKVESYIRSLADAEGDDFVSSVDPNAALFEAAVITAELGDGSSRTVRLGPETGETKRRNAAVSGSPYVYALAEWTVSRLLRDGSYFVTQ
jgi:hypothetical protein